MTLARQTEADIFAATARKLSEQGYDVVAEPDASLLPEALKRFRPDGIAIGRTPKLIVEVASEGPQDARRVAELQRALKDVAEWRLHLVLAPGTISSEIPQADDASIATFLERASQLAPTEPQAALLLAWAALEALSRSRRPEDFARPQSPGRIIERFASEGIITPSEATALRSMASKRNAFIHGDLSQSVKTTELRNFLDIIAELMNSRTLESGSNGFAL